MAIYREATLDDLASICALGAEVNAVHHAAWPDIFAAAGAPDRDRAVWAKSIGAGDATTFVALEHEAAVGFVTVSVVDESNSLFQRLRYARVGSVSVSAAHRGKGVGSCLMALAEQWALQRGAVEMRLNVWAFNEPAAALYRRLGYGLRSHLLGKRLSPSET